MGCRIPAVGRKSKEQKLNPEGIQAQVIYYKRVMTIALSVAYELLWIATSPNETIEDRPNAEQSQTKVGRGD